MKGIFDDAVLVEVINAGEEVCCDGCNGPYPENGDKINGGVIIGGSAYCQSCIDKYGYNDDDKSNFFPDIQIQAMDENKTFKQNVLDYRKKMTGTTDGITRIYTSK